MYRTSSLAWQKADSVIKTQITAEGVHVWPFRDSLPLDIRFLVLNRQHDLPPHRPSHFELIFLESGEVIYQAQGINSLVSTGDLVVVGNKLYHRCLKTAYLRPQVRAVVLYLTPKLLETWSAPAEELHYLMPFLYQDCTTPHVVRANTRTPAKISDLLHMLHAELSVASSRSRLAVRTYVKMILMLLLNHFAESRSTRRDFARASREMEHLWPLTEFLEAHYGGPVAAEDAAHALGMTKWHFIRFVKKTTGCSFVQYVNRFRIEKAKTLLTTTHVSIADLSQELGFCDQSYFGYLFRRLVRITPLQYRQQNAGVRLTFTTVVQGGAPAQMKSGEPHCHT